MILVCSRTRKGPECLDWSYMWGEVMFGLEAIVRILGFTLSEMGAIKEFRTEE